MTSRATGDTDDLDARAEVERRVPERRVRAVHRIEGKELSLEPGGGWGQIQTLLCENWKLVGRTTALEEERERVLVAHRRGEDALTRNQRAERGDEQGHDVWVVDLVSAHTALFSAHDIGRDDVPALCVFPDRRAGLSRSVGPVERLCFGRRNTVCCQLEPRSEERKLVLHALRARFARRRPSGVCRGASWGHSGPSSPRSVAITS